MRTRLAVGLLCLVVALASACNRVPPDGQVLRDARNRIEGQLGGALLEVGDFRVESVGVDAYEKDQAKAIASYKAGNFTGRLGLIYRRGQSSWKLEGTFDLGLK